MGANSTSNRKRCQQILTSLQQDKKPDSKNAHSTKTTGDLAKKALSLNISVQTQHTIAWQPRKSLIT